MTQGPDNGEATGQPPAASNPASTEPPANVGFTGQAGNQAPTQPPAQPPWGQYVPPSTPPGQWAEQQTPQQQPQWGQYAPNQQPQQQPQQQQQPPQWGQYAQPQPQQQQPPQWGQYQQPNGQFPPMGYTNYVAPPKPGVIPLRPLGLGEILDGSFQAARRNGKAMFGSALIFQMATALLTVLVMAIGIGPTSAKLLSGGFESDATNGTFSESDFSSLMSGLLTTLAVLIALQLIISVAQLVFQGALVIPVVRATLNRKTSFSLMWRLTRPHIGTLLLIGLIYAGAVVVIFGGYIGLIAGLFALGSNRSSGTGVGLVLLAVFVALLLFLVALWLSVKFMLAPAIAVCENRGPIQAMKRSWQLTAGSWWRVFGISILAAIIASTIAGIISIPIGLLTGMITSLMYPAGSADPANVMTVFVIQQAISGFIGAIIGAVTMAFQSGVSALLYVDLRMRRNGLDVTLLQEAELADDGGIPGSSAADLSALGTNKVAPAPYQGP